MTSNRSPRFPALNVSQTQQLLSGVSDLPLSLAASRRIRAAVLKKAAPKALARNRIRKTLLPIAACLIAVVMFFVAFPKAALAVSEFIGRIFTPSRYMNQDPADRTPVPSIDEAIAAAAPQDGDFTITLMSELPNNQEYIDFRAQNGHDSFAEENWDWLRDIRPEIAEVLYDGNQLIWNTNLYTTNEHVREFMEGFGIHSGSKLSVDALLDSATYTVAGDPMVYPLINSGGGITPIQDESSLSTADHVVLYSDFVIDPATPLPNGVITITQNIRVCENDAMDYGATVAIITHTFTFDTTKGNSQSADGAETLIPLSGEYYLTITHYGEGDESSTKETKKVSLDGIKLKANYEYLPTGIKVSITLEEAPADWTSDMISSLLEVTWRDIYDNFTKDGIANDLYIDDAFVSEAPTPDHFGLDELAYFLPVFPDQYDSNPSVVMKLYLAYIETYNGTDLLNGELYTLSSGEVKTQTNFVPLVEIPVPLPKN
ncbi:MAG: hypothetical protein CVV04_11620 [Firmicutes bacterium HGW-Firmicutes-9]|jgi:hypothetical protein|nr:MAG: hypothetical protein CVV04_11620 [Firmicutes bacterium HGW-Firmicutes-9]